MLKNHYHELNIGQNLPSLVRAILASQRGLSSLVIAEPKVDSQAYAELYLSHLEINALERIGKKYQIPELQKIRDFIKFSSVHLSTESQDLLLGDLPYQNFREFLRKFPEFLKPELMESFFAEKPDEFNSFFLSEMSRYEEYLYDQRLKNKFSPFELSGPAWLKSFFRQFNALLNASYSEIKDLRYKTLLQLLSLFHENKLKSSLTQTEIYFYFFRTFSQIFSHQEFFLLSQLRHRLSLVGGDYKQSKIQHWQLQDGKFINLLLASFEGVVGANKVLFFNHVVPEDVFNLETPYPLYQTLQVEPRKKFAGVFLPQSISILTSDASLGSNLPYRVLLRDSHQMIYHWPYESLNASKPSFSQARTELTYRNDLNDLNLVSEDIDVVPTKLMTLDLRLGFSSIKKESVIFESMNFLLKDDDTVIKDFDYWGNFKYTSFGLLSQYYSLERFS